jgi:hypothetical protein
MIRVTLLEDFGGDINLHFGAEVTVPMSFGAFDNHLVTEMRGERVGTPVQERRWPLCWKDGEKSALIPNEVATHHFGDWRAGTDLQAVRDKLLPSFNNERDRVARVWGDYLYAAEKDGEKLGYTTVRIAVPRVPNVKLTNVNASGNHVGDWTFRPLEFWRFEEILDECATREMARLQSRKGGQGAISLDVLDDAQLAKLAEMLEKRNRKAVAAAAK